MSTLNPTISIRTEQTSKMLKNTYMLLGVTVAWSAITAFFGTLANLGLGANLVLMLVGFGLLFATYAFKNSSLGLLFIMLFTGIQGFSLGPILNHYLNMANGAEVIMSAAGATALVFFALSMYVLNTKKDFSFMGGFLMVGIIAFLVLSVVSIFVQIPMLHMALGYIGVLLFSAFILYDTSNIVNGGEGNYISATVSLYLDVLNLFLSLLRVLGGSND